MNGKNFWNEVSKYGLMLGMVMGASKIFEQTLVVSGGLNYTPWVLLEWILFAILFFAILYKATKKRVEAVDPALGFSYFQCVNYMILTATLAAVPVACLYYVYINSIIGYDNYIDGLITLLVSAAEMQPLDSATSDMVEMLIEQMRSQPQASIFSTLIATIFQYMFAGLFAGLVLSGFIARKPKEILKSEDGE